MELPKTITSLVGIALTKLANRYAQEMQADSHLLEEAYNVVEQAAIRERPY